MHGQRETGSGHHPHGEQQAGLQGLLLRKTIEIADKFKDEPNLYMVYQLDFRGRAYCVPNYLNPGHRLCQVALGLCRR